MTNLLKKEPFGQLRIDKVRLSDAKLWLIKLQQKDGKSYSSIHSIRGVLCPAFQLAMDDDLIRKNPFQFELASVIVNDSVTREAITWKQQRDFLNFVKEDKYYCLTTSPNSHISPQHDENNSRLHHRGGWFHLFDKLEFTYCNTPQLLHR